MNHIAKQCGVLAWTACPLSAPPGLASVRRRAAARRPPLPRGAPGRWRQSSGGTAQRGRRRRGCRRDAFRLAGGAGAAALVPATARAAAAREHRRLRAAAGRAQRRGGEPPLPCRFRPRRALRGYRLHSRGLLTPGETAGYASSAAAFGIVRLEQVAESVARSGVRAAEFPGAYREALSERVTTPSFGSPVVGFKTVAADAGSGLCLTDGGPATARSPPPCHAGLAVRARPTVLTVPTVAGGNWSWRGRREIAAGRCRGWPTR